MPDSSDIDAAVLAVLRGDAALTALLPDGVFMDVGPPNMTKFGVVSVVIAEDRSVFQRRAIENVIYLVKAVLRDLPGADAKAAAARIDALLEGQPLTVPGYAWMTTERVERVRYPEVNEVDTTLRWQHRGGRYRVQMSLP